MHTCTSQRAFQSTPPVKAATIDKLTHTLKSIISIHAAREGGDKPCVRVLHFLHHFNPRRP